MNYGGVILGEEIDCDHAGEENGSYDLSKANIIVISQILLNMQSGDSILGMQTTLKRFFMDLMMENPFIERLEVFDSELRLINELNMYRILM
ncbi:hypothetical protein [Cytobacillus sp. IB215316]|uniref:hypothetical protein n=1 Tax=Cytobacillus sp. IB215316 TaxID=3097354 RepID=UPI002A17DD22|nr:hypothetical protein [Cytobacillus sp. IB215316]MDX8359268.1 hypothetical protein [Cytobacillus sp. IB215316]